MEQNNLGKVYLYGIGTKQDNQHAKYWFQQAAQQGNTESQSNLGQIYHEEKNYTQAKYWYQKAAEEGDSNAQLGLGKILYLQENYPQAKYWLEKAAEQDSSDAQLGLGFIYLLGQGVKQDFFKAEQYFRTACNNGFSVSCDEYLKLNRNSQ
ncbi:tetratricopeptide repeat protein [Gallibacterium salpingitidis]|uniref:tetratricopeptide repeat protein n=1 Tax=Gallibacterium salpingitidis TaxID=505341 RepID=UPI00346113EA